VGVAVAAVMAFSGLAALVGCWRLGGLWGWLVGRLVDDDVAVWGLVLFFLFDDNEGWGMWFLVFVAHAPPFEFFDIIFKSPSFLLNMMVVVWLVLCCTFIPELLKSMVFFPVKGLLALVV
jgi:hypothetical protein